ncbi:Ufm1-specific protease 2 [Strongyloides ratti]|uniref:Ufm1-specific protease n=1 Tax=Strongyloides ratti TaxID=34506 RepID=A0A090MW75_STRRB|nr:Ufm1-specific protease 2 [Strongyloides ratti]CEF63503.1 Ufm1-specific protease 2 [Strongyloides ratti]
MFKINYSQSCPNLKNDKCNKKDYDIALLFGIPSQKLITNVFFCEIKEYLDVASFIYSSITADIYLTSVVTLKNSVTKSNLDFDKLAIFTISKKEPEFISNVSIEDFKNESVSFLEKSNKLDLYTPENSSIFYLKYDLKLFFDGTNEDYEIERHLNQLSSSVFICESENIIINNKTEDEKNVLVLEKIMKDGKQLVFKTYYLSPESNVEQKIVPTIRQIDGKFNVSYINTPITVLLPSCSDQLKTIHSQMKEAIMRILLQMKLFYKIHKKFMEIHCGTYHLLNTNTLVNIINLNTENEEENMAYRKYFHNIFNLNLDIPVFRISQAFGSLKEKSHHLQNPHLSIKYDPQGECAILKGNYEYRHYLQDSFNDSGWGCAYRSFQTVWSWFLLQDFTDKPVPTHREIQQCLYNIGDKDASFVGSRQWIGSTEISFCLDSMLGISSRILSVNSGSQMNELAREILFHLKNNGAPIMIGGGQLAHTIIGIDFNSSTGDCNFLILDPHYTGKDDIQTIIKKGWCGWKNMDFWRKDSFYNLLLPINPVVNC